MTIGRVWSGCYCVTGKQRVCERPRCSLFAVVGGAEFQGAARSRVEVYLFVLSVEATVRLEFKIGIGDDSVVLLVGIRK
jgi:hypothetical protein